MNAMIWDSSCSRGFLSQSHLSFFMIRSTPITAQGLSISFMVNRHRSILKAIHWVLKDLKRL